MSFLFVSALTRSLEPVKFPASGVALISCRMKGFWTFSGVSFTPSAPCAGDWSTIL